MNASMNENSNYLKEDVFKKHFVDNGLPSIVVVIALSICIITGLIMLILFHPAEKELNVSGHIILIGVDGLSWSPILPLLKKGKLPNIAKLMKEGSYGDIKTSGLNLSTHVWTNIATGVELEKHGIAARYRMGTRGERMTLSTDWKFPSIWDRLSQAGIPLFLADWPASWPSLPVLGANSSDMLFPSWGNFKNKALQKILKRTYPEFLSHLILAEDKDTETFVSTQRKFSEIDVSIRNTIYKSKKADETTASASLYYLKKYNPLVSLIYLGGFHPFMKDVCYKTKIIKQDKGYSYPIYAVSNDKTYLVDDYLIFLDNVIGIFMKEISPEDTFMLLSGRGLIPGSIDKVPNDPKVSLPLGMFAVKGPGIKTHNRPILAGSLEITPTILYLLNQPLDVEIDGGVMMLAIKEALSFHRKVRFVSDNSTYKFTVNKR